MLLNSLISCIFHKMSHIYWLNLTEFNFLSLIYDIIILTVTDMMQEINHIRYDLYDTVQETCTCTVNDTM